MADTRSDTPQITIGSDSGDGSAESSAGKCQNSSSAGEGSTSPTSPTGPSRLEERPATFSLRSSPIGNVFKDSRPSSMAPLGGGSEGNVSAFPSNVASMRFSFLRPSQLASPDKFGSAPSFGGTSSNSTSAFPLKPARLRNPFARETEVKLDEPIAPTAGPSTQPPSFASTMPKFVPLGMPSTQTRPPTTPAPAATTTSSVSGFVFGQNLHERVTETPSESGADKPKETAEATNNGCVASTSNGTTENLFTSVLKREHAEKNNDSGSESGGEKPNKSLSEAAREYEEARAVKRKYEEVAVITGEEDEVNILQINCKLFAYDKSKSSWVERGRGNLRLNDKEIGNGQKQSRVIMRATGSLRVVLNTKLWAGMVVEKVSTKSVRLTAMDNSGEILVFLVMASPKDAESLFNYMDARVTNLRIVGPENASHPDAAGSSERQPNETWSEGQATKKLAADSDGVCSSHNTNDSSRRSEDSGGNSSCTGDVPPEPKEDTLA